MLKLIKFFTFVKKRTFWRKKITTIVKKLSEAAPKAFYVENKLRKMTRTNTKFSSTISFSDLICNSQKLNYGCKNATGASLYCWRQFFSPPMSEAYMQASYRCHSTPAISCKTKDDCYKIIKSCVDCRWRRWNSRIG